MDLGLAGRRAIVTGGTRGIGKASARALAREGADVVIVSRTLVELETAAREIERDTGRTVRPVACDTTDDASVRSMVERAVALLGGVDILVNCAAARLELASPRMGEITGEMMWADIDVKVMGYLRCIKEVAPHLAGRGGRIVNVSGLAARSTGSTLTSLRNAAVASLTKNLADELGAQGIGLVVVHPGPTRSDYMDARIKDEAERTGVAEEAIVRRFGSATALGRMADSAEVADVIAFLCSAKAAPINGDAVAVGGGVKGSIYF